MLSLEELSDSAALPDGMVGQGVGRVCVGAVYDIVVGLSVHQFVHSAVHTSRRAVHPLSTNDGRTGLPPRPAKRSRLILGGLILAKARSDPYSLLRWLAGKGAVFSPPFFVVAVVGCEPHQSP